MNKKVFLFFFFLFVFFVGIILMGVTHKKPQKLIAKINPIVKLSSLKPTFQPITLGTIFDETPNASNSSDLITLIVTGDVIPARTVNTRTIERGDFMWPYAPTAPFLSKGDITLIDLETSIFDQCPQIDSGFTFCGEDDHIIGLKAMGVDIASVGNNHAGNYGEEGVKKTMRLLKDNNIAVIGHGRPSNCPIGSTCGYQPIVRKTIKGTKFAFIGFNDITSPQPGVADVNDDPIQFLINAAKNWADVVVVSFHWGTEYQSQPDDRQIELAHFAIDSGADLVIGNHPHWIQPVELYEDKLIMYAHGNFIFDQMWSQETREGVVGTYTFHKDKLVDVTYTPIIIHDWGQARFAESPDKERILNNLKTESDKLAKQ